MVNGLYRVSNFNWASDGNASGYWSEFEKSIRHSQRYGDSEWPPLKDALLMSESRLNAGSLIYRARLTSAGSGVRIISSLKYREPIRPEQMGKPPPEFCRSGGRANAPGISVFYGARDASTAILEVRADLTTYVTVAKFKALKALRLVDLSKKIRLNSLREDRHAALFAFELRWAINWSFSEPMSSDDSAIGYVPTQYVSELIMSLGYDGFIFDSSLKRSGRNIVLKGEEKILAIESQLHAPVEIKVITQLGRKIESIVTPAVLSSVWNSSVKYNDLDDDIPF